MLKMIVMDMDGTLLGAGETITEPNKEALHQAMKEGIRLCIASGRSASGVLPLLKKNGLKADLILGNGAQFANEQGEVLSAHYFPKQRLKEVLDVFSHYGIHLMIFGAHDCYYSVEEPNIVRDAFLTRTSHRFGYDFQALKNDETKAYPCKHLVKKTCEELVNGNEETIKIEAFDMDTNKIALAKKDLPNISEIAFLSSFDDNVEVTGFQAQKGLILEEVLHHFHLTKQEVLVMGDGMNDLTLFERFPYSYAPANSVEEIKALAYKVVSSCDETDVKDAIEDFKALNQ